MLIKKIVYFGTSEFVNWLPAGHSGTIKGNLEAYNTKKF